MLSLTQIIGKNVRWFIVFASTLSLLGACSHTMESRFYTLEKPSIKTQPITTINAENSQKKMVFELAMISLPAQVKGTRIVTSDNTGELKIHEFERWSQPLDEEIRQTLSKLIASKLDAIDIHYLPKPNINFIQINVKVQQFKNVLNQYALINAAWTLKLRDSHLTMTCESEEMEAVKPGIANMVSGQQHILENLSNKIAKSAITALKEWKNEKVLLNKPINLFLNAENSKLNEEINVRCVSL